MLVDIVGKPLLLLDGRLHDVGHGKAAMAAQFCPTCDLATPRRILAGLCRCAKLLLHEASVKQASMAS